MYEGLFPKNNDSYLPPLRQPLYQQVKSSIIQKIQSGQWQHDDVLPNEIELSKMFNVSQGTLRRALKELVQEGFLVRRQGKGTFINSYNLEFENFYSKFVPIRADDPDCKWKTRVQMIEYEEIKPSPRICRLMGIDDTNEDIIHIKRFFPTMTEELFKGQKESLYAFYLK